VDAAGPRAGRLARAGYGAAARARLQNGRDGPLRHLRADRRPPAHGRGEARHRARHRGHGPRAEHHRRLRLHRAHSDAARRGLAERRRRERCRVLAAAREIRRKIEIYGIDCRIVLCYDDRSYGRKNPQDRGETVWENWVNFWAG